MLPMVLMVGMTLILQLPKSRPPLELTSTIVIMEICIFDISCADVATPADDRHNASLSCVAEVFGEEIEKNINTSSSSVDRSPPWVAPASAGCFGSGWSPHDGYRPPGDARFGSYDATAGAGSDRLLSTTTNIDMRRQRQQQQHSNRLYANKGHSGAGRSVIQRSTTLNAIADEPHDAEDVGDLVPRFWIGDS